MASCHQKVILLAGLFLFLDQSVAQQRATLYSTVNCQQTNNQNNVLAVYERYVPQLGLLGYDGIARSVSVFGMWLFYDLPYYNYGKNAPMQYHFRPNSNNCIDLKELQGKVSSLRVAGNLYDYRTETLTIYEDTFFQGVEEIFTGNTRTINLDRRISSLIITGQSGWTLYDGPNFQGKSVCVFPKTNDGSPAIITDTNSVRMPNRVVRSVGKGCKGRKTRSVMDLFAVNATNYFANF